MKKIIIINKIVFLKYLNIVFFFNLESNKVVTAKYQFSSDIVETLHIYYFMLFESMWKVSNLLTITRGQRLLIRLFSWFFSFD